MCNFEFRQEVRMFMEDIGARINDLNDRIDLMIENQGIIDSIEAKEDIDGRAEEIKAVKKISKRTE